HTVATMQKSRGASTGFPFSVLETQCLPHVLQMASHRIILTVYPLNCLITLEYDCAGSRCLHHAVESSVSVIHRPGRRRLQSCGNSETAACCDIQDSGGALASETGLCARHRLHNYRLNIMLRHLTCVRADLLPEFLRSLCEIRVLLL